MPIRKDLKPLYPRNWPEISVARKRRAGWRCETCGAPHGLPHPVTGSIVVLATAHLDRDPANNPEDGSNHRVLCQRCHLAYDRPDHLRTSAATRRRRMATLELPFPLLS